MLKTRISLSVTLLLIFSSGPHAQSLTPTTPGGSDGQIQYKLSGRFSGIAGTVVDSSGNVKFGGGSFIVAPSGVQGLSVVTSPSTAVIVGAAPFKAASLLAGGSGSEFEYDNGGFFAVAATAAGNLGQGVGTSQFVIYGGAPGLAIDISSSGLIRLQGETSAFPALKRSGTALQVRLADDSGDAPLQSSLSTIAIQSSAPTAPAAGYINLYALKGTGSCTIVAQTSTNSLTLGTVAGGGC